MAHGSVRRFIRDHALVVFFVGAYALSWTPILFGPRSVFPFAALLVALAVLALSGGRPAERTCSSSPRSARSTTPETGY